ncbi:MAG: methyltransferase [Desulfamplus sp.]|nr:methyltransferase [Desulfamplus sp.]
MEISTSKFTPFEIIEPLANNISELLEIAKGIQIEQPDKGYRFAIDPFLLVADITPKEGEEILDIGTGCGIIPLLLATKYPHINITAVEIQNELAEIAQKNIKINNLCRRIKLINNDIKEVQIRDIEPSYIDKHNTTNYSRVRKCYSNHFRADFIVNCGFDRIISNPPYKKKGSGRLNSDIQKAIARHEIALTLDELIFNAVRFLKTDGILNLIYPFCRLKELLHTISKYSIEPIQIKYLFTTKLQMSIDKPRFVLMVGKKRG